jgi:hypothetical protein
MARRRDSLLCDPRVPPTAADTVEGRREPHRAPVRRRSKRAMTDMPRVRMIQFGQALVRDRRKDAGAVSAPRGKDVGRAWPPSARHGWATAPRAAWPDLRVGLDPRVAQRSPGLRAGAGYWLSRAVRRDRWVHPFARPARPSVMRPHRVTRVYRLFAVECGVIGVTRLRRGAF